ncbi:SRPBCC family protein [Actinoplanes sp. NBC_00393]|uniref:SRPBCC family protein n=1 Tax=Actinoplanes sp. NBC_00393 TaxID=2975953 RepID=UPI002E2010A3
MTNTPTGRLDGNSLVLTRTFRAGIEDVWASLTEPERTARWYGAWKGDAAPGRTIQVQMAYEEGTPWTGMRIDACEPPRRLSLSSTDMPEVWRLDLLLTHADGRTELRFVHHLTPSDGLGEVGPGWEYYLDMLVAARDGTALPDFEDYYPSMKAYYDGLAG